MLGVKMPGKAFAESETLQNKCDLPSQSLKLAGTEYSCQKEMHERTWHVQGKTRVSDSQRPGNEAGKNVKRLGYCGNKVGLREPVDTCQQGGGMSSLFSKVHSDIIVADALKCGES